MSKFVNYRKRSVTLPHGCKDLVDVLREPPKHDAAASQGVPVPKPERIPTHGLDHLVRFMTEVLESAARFTSLDIGLPGRGAAIAVLRHKQSENFALMLFVQRDTEEERSIRAFFERQRIDPTIDYLTFPVTPSAFRGLRYPLPHDAASAARLVTDFLKEVHALEDDAGIDFTLEKHDQAA